jgi:hypothetical protein
VRADFGLEDYGNNFRVEKHYATVQSLEKGTFYLFVFFGRPRGRKLPSRPSVAAVWEAQVSDPGSLNNRTF